MADLTPAQQAAANAAAAEAQRRKAMEELQRHGKAGTAVTTTASGTSRR